MNGPPDGFVVRLGSHVRVRDGGRTLIGGSPLRVSHLHASALELFVGDTITVESARSRMLADALLASGMAEPILDTLDDVELGEVTCIIPVRDRPQSLDRLLSSLDGLAHVLVVDDCSFEPQAVADVAAKHGADLIALDHNRGPAGARNAGLRAVTTPYVLFVDSDVVLHADAVRRLVKHFVDPKVGAVAPRIRGLGPVEGWVASYEDARSSLDLGPDSGLVHPRSKVSWVPSAVLMARVEAMGEGFDASMNVGEDVDLIWRLTASGWRVRYEAAVEAYHDHRIKFVPWLERKAFYGTGASLLAERHGPKVAPAVFGYTSLAAAGAVLAQRRWSLPVVALAAVITNIRLTRTLGKSPQPRRLAAELTALGISASLAQVMGLLLRHWWPLAAIGSLFSARMRRAVMLAAIVDVIIEHRRLSPDMNIFQFAIARRLDDVAYGAGLWAGAFRQRSITSLVPDIVHET